MTDDRHTGGAGAAVLDEPARIHAPDRVAIPSGASIWTFTKERFSG